MNEPVPQVFPIQGLSLAALLAALVLALVAHPVEDAGVAGVSTGTWTYAWHALALSAGIAGIVTGRAWTIPLVIVGAAGAITSTTPPQATPRAVGTWVAYGLLVFLHLELRDGAARVSAHTGGAGIEVRHIARSYLRRAAGASAATAGLAAVALTFSVWGAWALPAPVAHGVEMQGVYGLLLGVALVFAAVLAAVAAVRLVAAGRPAP